MYARPRFEDGETTTLGVSGKLWREALIMYDRRSKTLWSQIDGQAKVGPLKGQALEKIPSQVTTWAAWKKRHPDTLVLVKPALEGSPYASYHASASWVGLPWARGKRDDRLPPKTLVLGIVLRSPASDMDSATTKAETAVAMSPQSLASNGVHSDEIDGTKIVVVGPEGPRSALVYESKVGETVLELQLLKVDPAGPVLLDPASGSHFDWQTGEALSGPLAGQRLKPLAATPIYWSTWVAFHPHTELW